MKKMNIRNKILASQLSILLMFLVVIAMTYYSSQKVTHFQAILSRLENQLTALTNLRSQVRNQLFDVYDESFVDAFRNDSKKIKFDKTDVLLMFSDFEKTIQGSTETESAASLHASYDEIFADLQVTLSLVKKRKFEQAKQVAAATRQYNFNDGFIKISSQLMDTQKKSLEENSVELNKSTRRLQNVLIALAALTSLLSITIAMYTFKSIGARLVGLVGATKQIGAGSFDIRLDESGSDEVSLLSKAFNQMTQSLLESRVEIQKQQQLLTHSAKMSSLGEMAGGVAHEINNPLAIIKTLSEQMQDILSDEQIDKTMLVQMTTKVINTSGRIAKIVQGLRTFSRNGENDQFASVNVHNLIEETLSFCKERFNAHNTALTVDPISKDLCFDGRATQISQVVLNLLNNAFDAIAEKNEKWIKISVVESREFINIKITDSGSGITPAIKQKIFQPFFTTKEIGKGTGMGLSISMGIIESHKGRIEIDDKCENTCFVIHLPRKLNQSTDLAA